MPRIVLLIGFSLLFAESSFAQDAPDQTPMQCQHIKLAVVQCGLPLPDSTPWKLTVLTP